MSRPSPQLLINGLRGLLALLLAMLLLPALAHHDIEASVPGSRLEGSVHYLIDSGGQRQLADVVAAPASAYTYLSSRVCVLSSSKLARCRIRPLLLRISTDSPSISPTIPPCYSLRRQRSARGCSATRHWDLGPLQA